METRSAGHDFQSLYPGIRNVDQSPSPEGSLALLLGVGGRKAAQPRYIAPYRDREAGPENLTCGFIVRSVRVRAREHCQCPMGQNWRSGSGWST
jgi:hypothetical protein